ncbi:MAG: ATP-binding cassette domain-containing protein [Armatimonadetes bacterium]|nr:ATP-binding cassette domain-containing protein [Armatimonadota bacterium]
MIHVSNIGFSYGANVVLQDISFAVHPGEMTALVGPSGSGKTTLLGIISGDLPGFEGEVTVDGESLRGKARVKGLAQIYQDYRLVPFIDAKANVSLAIELRERSTSAELADHSAGALVSVGPSDKAELLPVHLSGGEQQRLAIARAVATRPSYILTDEPTGSLDSANSVHIAQLLLQIARESQVGVLVATHDPLVSRLADHVVGIRDGRVMSAE